MHVGRAAGGGNVAAQYPRTVYVLGTDRNIGKTVTCMGIIASLLAAEGGPRLDEIGYIKPVGQQTLTVVNGRGVTVEADKDAVLATALMGVGTRNYEWLSPVVWADGVTAEYIDEARTGDPHKGREAFLQRIREAYQHVAEGKRIVLAEGTGQPGVGSVAGISNADVIRALREMGVPLYVVLVTRGGIGSTIDQLFPYLMLLEHMGVRADGVIVNGVYPAKLEKIRHYITSYYERIYATLYGDRLHDGVPTILGFIPSMPELRLPTMRLVAEELSRGDDRLVEVVAPQAFEARAHQWVRDVKVISLDSGFEPFLQPGDAVVVGVNANDAILSVLLLHERMLREHGEGLAGLLLSCRQVGGMSQQIRDLIASSDLPALLVALDSATIVQRVEGMTIKIQPYDVTKKELIARTFRQVLTPWPELTQ